MVRLDQSFAINRFIIYAKSITLQFQISKHSSNGRIYPPIISIDYDIIEQKFNQNSLLETEFNLTFHMEDSNIKYNLNIAVSIFGSFGVLWSIFRTWCWMRRSGRKRLDLIVLGTFLIKSLSSLSNILLVITLLFIINQLIIFKFQSIIHTVMFTPSQEYSIILYVIVAYFFKLIELTNLLLDITSVDIFFLDWEKPRKREILENYGKLEDKCREKTDQRSDTMQNNHQSLSANYSPFTMLDSTQSNITIWRSYFVANEWCELATQRRINISVHIFVLIFIFEVF